jgi:hypothetical protein
MGGLRVQVDLGVVSGVVSSAQGWGKVVCVGCVGKVILGCNVGAGTFAFPFLSALLNGKAM